MTTVAQPIWAIMPTIPLFLYPEEHITVVPWPLTEHYILGAITAMVNWAIALKLVNQLQRKC